MSVYLNYDGYHSAKQMIGHGKVDEGPFELTEDDERKMLGSEGTDIQEHSKHHLGVDDDKPWTSAKRNRYPFGKEGRLYTQAVHKIRNEADASGHEDIRDAASKLLGYFKLKDHPDERSIDERKIIKKADGWHVMSEDGKKHLGGPYKSEEEAKKRLGQIEFFKHKGEKSEKSLFLAPEMRLLLPIQAELRVEKGPNGQRRLIGYAAVFDKMSQDLGGFREKIDKKAFENVLKTADVRGLRNHDPDKVLARTKSGTMKLFADETGLGYDMKARDTQLWRDTLDDVESKDIDGSSFSFTAEPKGGDSWDDTTDPPTRTLMNIRDLFDVGPVSFPAYTDTDVHARNCRSFQEFRATRLDPMAAKYAAQERKLKILEMRLGVSLIGNS